MEHRPAQGLAVRSSPGAAPTESLSEEVRRLEHDRYNAVLVELARGLTDGWGDLDRAIRHLTEIAAETLDVARVGVWLYGDERRQLRCVDSFELGSASHRAGDVLVVADHPAYFRAIENDRAVVANEAQTHPATRGFAQEYLRPYGITSLLDVPLRLGGATIGVLCHEHQGAPRCWSAEEESFATSLGDFLVLAIEGSRRREAERELEEQRSFLRLILDLNPSLIFAKDRQGTFTLANRAVAEIYGTTVEDLVGKTDADFNQSPAEVEHFRQADCEVMDRRQRLFIAEEELTDARGALHYLQTVKIPIVDASGQADQVLGVATDITERKLAEEKRAALEESLRQAQKMESIGQLAGGMAHDFNNLLTPILAYSEAALQELSADLPQRGYMEDVLNAAQRASELTSQLLAFSRKQVLELRSMDVNLELRRSRDILARLIPENIEIALDLDPLLPPALADPTQVQQIVMNLVINARDAMPEGGRITVTTGEAVGESGAGGHVWVEVRDTGCGMAPDILARACEPFFTTKDRGRGSGLGLSTVYGIVEQHGGRMRLESTPGEGTRVRLRLPAASTPPVEESVRPSPRSEIGVGTILVVEDEESVRRLVQRVLSARGYQIVTAGDPEGALRTAAGVEGTIDLLLTDVVLPKMNGPELFDALRASRPGLRVMYMSGYPPDQVTPQGLVGQGKRFLRKPFTASGLAREVAEAFEGSDDPAPL